MIYTPEVGTASKISIDWVPHHAERNTHVAFSPSGTALCVVYTMTKGGYEGGRLSFRMMCTIVFKRERLNN